MTGAAASPIDGKRRLLQRPGFASGNLKIRETNWRRGRAASRVETSRNLRHTHSNLSHDASAHLGAAVYFRKPFDERCILNSIRSLAKRVSECREEDDAI